MRPGGQRSRPDPGTLRAVETRPRRRWWRRAALAAAGLALALGAASWLGRPWLEGRVRERIAREAGRRGLVARVEEVRIALRPVLALRGLRVEKPGAWVAEAESVEAGLRLSGRGLLGRTSLSFGPARITGPAGLAAVAVPSRWDLHAPPEGGLRADLVAPAPGGLAVSWSGEDGALRAEVRAREAPLGRLLTVLRDGERVADLGTVDGALRARTASGGRLTFDLALRARAARLATLASAPGEDAEPLGLPTDVALEVAGAWDGTRGDLDVPRWRFATSGAALTGRLTLLDTPRDPRVELSLDVERVDFARVLRSAGLEGPEEMSASSGGELGDGSLGSASLTARMAGRLADPASFTVSQRLDFVPPDRPLPALERLRGDFVHEVQPSGGGRRSILVSPASPDFVPLADVPPLFVRTLLLGEDYGFFGHPGLDLAEVPAAVLANWSRGAPARGASTITQQLAKNLFLTRERRLGRKLQELSLALLLEATLGKERILEIYLNVIEWGPGLYGLRPAARRYFSKEPRDLGPAQMALLVALVPGPVKYQRSLARGTPSPGFRPLVDNLLAKLRDLEAIDEEQYEAALADPLLVSPALPEPDPEDETGLLRSGHRPAAGAERALGIPPGTS